MSKRNDKRLKRKVELEKLKVKLPCGIEEKQPSVENNSTFNFPLSTFNESRFVGTMEIDRRGARVSVNSKWYKKPIFIPAHHLNGARDGERVVIQVLGRNIHARWEGKVLERLGEIGEHETEMHAILEEFGLPYSYPEELEKAANKISGEITAQDLAERQDFREVTTFTIDPENAKDFDDAISIEKVELGKLKVELPFGSHDASANSTFNSQLSTLYKIGVHIADVAHYVKEGYPIDNEAFIRGTSVYLVDRTVPMLPEHLCNYVCSLRPDEDKLCYSVIFTMNEEAEVLSYEICHTVIRSNRRFTYEEAQERIETRTGDFAEEIVELHSLAQKMREKRLQNGALAFSRQEMRFELAPDGTPVKTYMEAESESHYLIEEFMLLANKTVATHIGKLHKPFVYRVHDLPNEDKMKELSGFMKQLGYSFKLSQRQNTTMRQINQLFEKAKGTAEENIVETLVMRCMAKAVYSTENIGHFGLAFRYYTHFTSPIRRYPDIMVHRLLDEYLRIHNSQCTIHNDSLRQKVQPNGNYELSIMNCALEDKCKHCSERERMAADAEKASVKYKQVEYMEARADKAYAGIITNVTEWGVYVEIEENGCEGLVSIHDLPGREYYDFYPEEFALVGFRTGRRFTIGDRLYVRVRRANLQKRQLDFVIIEENRELES